MATQTKRLGNELLKNWEIKDRTYYLTDGKEPASYTLRGKNMVGKPLQWFNEETGETHTLRYAMNQNSPFELEQQGQIIIGHIVFRDGTLFVGRGNQVLQKLLSLYHPHKDKLYYEHDPVSDAIDEDALYDLQFEAESTARELDINHLEAIVRGFIGNAVVDYSVAEIKLEAKKLARRAPEQFMDLVNDDTLQLRNLAIRGKEEGVIKLINDNTVWVWGGNGKKITSVPFGENPYGHLASFMQTDDGASLLASIKKKLD